MGVPLLLLSAWLSANVLRCGTAAAQKLARDYWSGAADLRGYGD